MMHKLCYGKCDRCVWKNNGGCSEWGGPPMIELKPCPKCGRVPMIGYACGEYFIVGNVADCPVCDGFTEMHSSEETEIEAWNRRANK